MHQSTPQIHSDQIQMPALQLKARPPVHCVSGQDLTGGVGLKQGVYRAPDSPQCTTYHTPTYASRRLTHKQQQ